MSYLYQKLKNKWGSLTSFWRYYNYPKVQAYFEKSALVIQCDLNGCRCKNIMSESLETSLHCRSSCGWIYSLLHFQTLRASKCAEFDNPGVTLIFCSFFDNWREFIKEGDVSKKSGGHRPHKTAKSWRCWRFGHKCYICLQIFLHACPRWMIWCHCDMNLRAQWPVQKSGLAGQARSKINIFEKC